MYDERKIALSKISVGILVPSDPKFPTATPGNIRSIRNRAIAGTNTLHKAEGVFGSVIPFFSESIVPKKNDRKRRSVCAQIMWSHSHAMWFWESSYSQLIRFQNTDVFGQTHKQTAQKRSKLKFISENLQLLCSPENSPESAPPQRPASSLRPGAPGRSTLAASARPSASGTRVLNDALVNDRSRSPVPYAFVDCHCVVGNFHNRVA